MARERLNANIVACQLPPCHMALLKKKGEKRKETHSHSFSRTAAGPRLAAPQIDRDVNTHCAMLAMAFAHEWEHIRR